jgi:hypothetical protein
MKPTTPAATEKEMSLYEMHVTRFSEGSTLKNFTYRGDKTLAYYHSMQGYHKPDNELNALLLKFRNSPRILNATIYDNTGEPKRVAIIKIENRTVVNDLTGTL